MAIKSIEIIIILNLVFIVWLSFAIEGNFIKNFYEKWVSRLIAITSW